MLYARVSFGNIGRIATINVDIFRDAGLTQRLTFVDWGVLVPGESMNHSAYVASPGNMPVNISCYAEDWSPAVAVGAGQAHAELAVSAVIRVGPREFSAASITLSVD